MVPATASQQREPGWESIIGPYDRWLYQRVRHTMRRNGLRPWSEEVREYVQEVYCRLLQGGPQRLGRLRRLRRATLFVYLGRVADAVIVDQLRAAGAIKRIGDAQHPARKSRLKVDLEDPERIFLRSERHRLLVRRLFRAAEAGGVSERGLQILWLAFVEEWRSHEIARVFRIKPRTVDTMLSKLRRRFAREGLELGRRPPRRYDAARCASSRTLAASAIPLRAAIRSARSVSRGL